MRKIERVKREAAAGAAKNGHRLGRWCAINKTYWWYASCENAYCYKVVDVKVRQAGSGPEMFGPALTEKC